MHFQTSFENIIFLITSELTILYKSTILWVHVLFMCNKKDIFQVWNIFKREEIAI